MATVIQPFGLRSDTAANWTAANPVLLPGQEGYESDTRKRKVGDGTSAWNDLLYDVADGGSGGGVSDGVTITGLWNGVSYESPAGVVFTDANRPANTLRSFRGGPDPVTLSLTMLPGDEWKTA